MIMLCLKQGIKTQGFILGLVSLSLFSYGAENRLLPISFSQTEIQKIASLGPWPLDKKIDTTNSLSQLKLAQSLGEKLFHDPQLSDNKLISCANCHQPNNAFTDKKNLAQGLHLGSRNTPSLWNVSLKRWYGWGGDIDTLWGASLRALLDPKEMGATETSITHYLTTQPQLINALSAFPLWQEAKSAQNKLVVIGKLLAAYQELLISEKSEFDYFREALIKQDDKAMAEYSDSKKRGLKLFIGKGNCQICHSGPLFSNKEFADIGMSYFDREGKVDKGRYQGIKSLKASPFSTLGAYNQDMSEASRIQAKHLVLKHRNFGEFMVPSLRNIALSPPYMHQGDLKDLDQVINHYSDLDEERLHTDGVAILQSLHLSETEKADLKAFLESL